MFSSASPRLFFLLTLLAVHIPFIPAQHAPSRRDRVFGKRDAFSDSGLSLGSWIWLPEPDLNTTAPIGSVAFLKKLATPAGKTAASAQIAITVDNNFTLWCNAQPIGMGADFQTAQVFSMALNASDNVFSVLGTNISPGAPSAANPAGLLAAIRVSYTDGSNETFLSDNTWQASGTVPTDFPVPLDLSSFAPAEVITQYGSGPWRTSVTVPAPIANPLNLTGSSWIWSTTKASTDAPVGTVGFRKTVVSPSDKSASSATVVLSADNTFQLLINGQYIGSPPFDSNAPGISSWEYAQRFTVSLTPSTNVFTVLATNFPPQQTDGTSAAGFVAALQINYTDGSSDIIRTDTSWLTGPVTSASSFLTAADSTLGSSISQGSFGIAPWGQLRGISDALSAVNLPANAAVALPTSASTTTATTSSPLQAPTTILPTSEPSTSTPAGSSTGGARDPTTPTLVLALSTVMTFFFLL